jgi:hypothetical protein
MAVKTPFPPARAGLIVWKMNRYRMKHYNATAKTALLTA